MILDGQNQFFSLYQTVGVNHGIKKVSQTLNFRLSWSRDEMYRGEDI